MKCIYCNSWLTLITYDNWLSYANVKCKSKCASQRYDYNTAWQMIEYEVKIINPESDIECMIHGTTKMNCTSFTSYTDLQPSFQTKWLPVPRQLSLAEYLRFIRRTYKLSIYE